MKYMGLLIIVLLLICCSRQRSSIPEIDILAPDGQEIKNLSEIAADIQYVPLETRPEALMRGVNYLKVKNERYYINTVLEILCFDESGRFLFKLSQQGRGPGEYTYLPDFDVHPEKDLMILLTLNKLFFYNITDTGFVRLRELDMKMKPRQIDFIPGSDDILLTFESSSGEHKYQSVGITQQGDTLFKRPNFYSFVRNSKVVMGYNIDNAINKVDGELTIKALLSDTVYRINKDHEFVPGMIINTEGKGLTADFLANVPAGAAASGIDPSADFLHITSFLEAERFTFCRYRYLKSGKWIVYDNKAGRSNYFDVKTLLKDDISGGPGIEPKFVCNGVIYSWTSALALKTWLSGADFRNAEAKDQKRRSELEKLAATLQEDDNHVLIAITPNK